MENRESVESKDPKPDDWVDVEAIKRHMARSAAEKLQWLEEVNLFFEQFMPDASKKAWQQMKREGW